MKLAGSHRFLRLPDSRDAILFVRSESPGAVFRYIERRQLGIPGAFFLSDSVGPHLVRALFSSAPSGAWFVPLGGALAVAFPPVEGILRGDSGWEWRRWDSEGESRYANIPLPTTPRWLRRWTPTPLEHWAKSHDLPLARAAVGVPITDSLLVAQLDQKSLLREDTPRLYRFSCGVEKKNFPKAG